jgi:RimJ/RimL family protein N-acetyltransferase
MTERRVPSQVRIEPYSEADLGLLMQCNAPEMTEHLDGPESEEKVLNRHQRYLAFSEPGTGGMFRIVLLPGGEPVGIIGYWEREGQGETVYETGWSVLPEVQGRGIGTAAVHAVVEHARTHGKHRAMHAYPSITNLPSNAICRKAGFELLGAYDFEYPPGNPLRCDDWRIDLS